MGAPGRSLLFAVGEGRHLGFMGVACRTAVALAILACEVQRAFADEPAPPADTHADWLKQPSPDALMSVWPRPAVYYGEGGRAVIGCTVTVQGLLRDCRVLFEDPVESGFGPAALQLSSQFMMKPAMRDGRPVESLARIPIVFKSFRPKGPIRTQLVIPSVLLDAAPTYAQVAAAYPQKARAKAVRGLASLRCVISPAGEVKNCVTLSEAPAGEGFGAAAKSLAPHFHAPAKLKDGTATEHAFTQITVAFVPEMLSAATPPVIGKPNWLSKPSGPQLLSGMPNTADTPDSILVVLDCLIGADGHLSDCKVDREDPPGHGYGVGGLASVSYFRVSVWTAEGLPSVGARVKVPIRYQYRDAPPPPAPKP